MRCLAAFLLLLTACTEPAATGPPGIVFTPDEIDVGRLEPGGQRRVEIPWRRTGGGALRVLAVESACACALAGDAPRGLQAAGASGTLVVRLSASRRAGPFHHRLTLYTDQPPPRDVVRARLTGWSGSRLGLAPGSIDLGWRSPGVRLRRDAEVRLSEPLPALGARLVGLQGSVRMLPPVRAGVPGRLLRIDLTTPGAVGRFEGRVLLEEGGRVLGTLPIRGVVEP